MIHDTQFTNPAWLDIVFNNIHLLDGAGVLCLYDLFQPCLWDLAHIGSMKFV